MAIGVAIMADKMVTMNDPKIIGRAPNDPELGSHFPSNKKASGLTLLTKKVDSPFWATKTRIIATIKTIKTRQKNVMPRPNFSKREFFDGEVNCFSSS